MLSVCNSKMIALKKIGKKGQFICKLKNIIEIDRFKMLQYISNCVMYYKTHVQQFQPPYPSSPTPNPKAKS